MSGAQMCYRRQSHPPLLKGNQGEKAPKWLPAYFNFEKRNASKSEREWPSTLRDWPLVHPFSGTSGGCQGECKSVHFSLDGCPLSSIQTATLQAALR